MSAAPHVTPTPPARAEVLGVPLAISDYAQILDWMDATIASAGRAWLTAAAVNLVICAADDPQVRSAVLGATLAVPDGQPLVWALRCLGHRDATRVSGPELMARHCERAAASRTPIFLYGGRDEARLSLLRESLRHRFPGLRIAGGFSPPPAPSCPSPAKASPPRSTEAARRWSGSAPGSPSRSCGWPRCARC